MKQRYLLVALLAFCLLGIGALIVVQQGRNTGDRPPGPTDDKALLETSDRKSAGPAEGDARAPRNAPERRGTGEKRSKGPQTTGPTNRQKPSTHPANTKDGAERKPAAAAIGGNETTSDSPEDETESDAGSLAAIEGKVRYSNGQPVPGVDVAATSGNKGTPRTCKSGTDGEFSFEGLPHGSWHLTAQKNRATGSAGPVPVAEDNITYVTIYLGVESCLAGSILDQESREPVPGVQLDAKDAQRRLSGTAFSDPQGRFRMNVPSPGSFRFYVPRGQEFLAAQGSVTVELAHGECREDLLFFVRKGIALEGTVRKDEQPVADAHVVLVDLFNDQGGNKGETLSDGQGHFEFIGQKPGGNYVARAIHPEHGMGESEPVLTRPGGALGKLDVHLRRGRTARGRLLTHLGQGVPDIEVWVIRNRGQPWRPMPGTRDVSTTDGSFSMANIPPGEYQFVVTTADTTRLISDNFSVVEGEDPERLDISLGQGVEGFIEGQVTSPAGEPLRSVEVVAHPQKPRMVAATNTGADGRYRLDGLGPAPKHTVWARGFRLGRVRKPLNDVPVNSSDVDFVLGKMSVISGKVVEAQTGEPVTSFHVTGPLVSRDFESPDGSFTIDDLQVTQGAFTFTSPGYADAVYDPGEVKEGELIEGIVVKMKPGTWLEGIVTNTADTPVQGARAKLMLLGEKDLHDLYREYNWKASDPYTDAQGRFFLQGNSEGEPNSFVVWHPDYAPTVVSNTLEKKFDIILGTVGSTQD